MTTSAMEHNFPEALAHTLEFEGGWANHPNDPGGATMKGITHRTYADYLGRAITHDELRAIPDDHLAEIYRRRYWDACRCDALPDGLDLAVFDTAVNTGPAQAARLLQRIVGVPADGVIGPKSIAAVNDYVGTHGLHALIEAYTVARQNFYRLLPTYVHFGEGWRKRAEGVAKVAKEISPPGQHA
jgi:lysozyme family protein